MKRTQRAAAIALLAAAAIATPVAASASPASSPAQTATAAIRLKATIPVEIFPLGVAVNPKTNTIYVVNNFDSTVSVLGY